MNRIRVPLIALYIAFILVAAGRECHAVIYKYVNENGAPHWSFSCSCSSGSRTPRM